MRRLNQEAAKAMRYGGLSETEALKLVTLNPAKQLGIDNRVGLDRRRQGRRPRHLRQASAERLRRASRSLIDGTVYFDRQKDIAGRATLEQERKTLTRKAQERTEAARPVGTSADVAGDDAGSDGATPGAKGGAA